MANSSDADEQPDVDNVKIHTMYNTKGSVAESTPCAESLCFAARCAPGRSCLPLPDPNSINVQ